MTDLLTHQKDSTRLVSRQLSARVAPIAARLADVIEAAGSAESGATEAAVFLRDWAASTVGGEPVEDQQPLDHLAERFALSELECDLLLLAGLAEEHEGLAGTFRALNPAAEPWPTVGLAALVLEVDADRATVRELLCDGALTRHRLVRVTGTGPLFEQGLRPADRLWEALHGCDGWPEWLPRVAIGEVPPGLSQWALVPDVQRAGWALRSDDSRTVLVQSADETIALGRCAALAVAAEVVLVAGRVSAGDGPAIRSLVAHAAVRNAVPLMVVEPDSEVPSRAPTLALTDVPGPVVVCAPPGLARVGPHRPVMMVPSGPVTAADRRDAWGAALPELVGHAAALAARHPLDPALTAQVALDARAGHRLGANPADVGDISELIRARAGVTLPPGIKLVTPSVEWDRLVISEDAGAQLRQAVSRLDFQAQVLDDWQMLERARAARGGRILLTGPPGTGKSLAAEALATAARTDLLQMDASQVVSKWIGETEKNLSAAFDVAERTQAVLFVDEADALFGARTEISDAHDRYANLETAYLLQRLDLFDGLVVLATNLRNNIDAAFMRRMDFVIDLPLPDVGQRKRLWELHLPVGRLADDVDLDMLARLYPIPGGWIRNASIAATFCAAANGDGVHQQFLVDAVRREFAKAALPFPGEPPRSQDDL